LISDWTGTDRNCPIRELSVWELLLAKRFW
jgi:hypothetical protein